MLISLDNALIPKNRHYTKQILTIIVTDKIKRKSVDYTKNKGNKNRR